MIVIITDTEVYGIVTVMTNDMVAIVMVNILGNHGDWVLYP